jgi:hypothetical protein
VKTYLGRPWRDFSNVIYLNTEMFDVVRPENWQNWNLPARVKTARYSEYNSNGPGPQPQSTRAGRINVDKNQAKAITIRRCSLVRRLESSEVIWRRQQAAATALWIVALHFSLRLCHSDGGVVTYRQHQLILGLRPWRSEPPDLRDLIPASQRLAASAWQNQ